VGTSIVLFARRSPLTTFGMAMIALLLLSGLLAPLLAPYSPTAASGPTLAPPSANHLLGTDSIGSDILSQLLWGARPSLLIAIPAAALNVAVATVVGASAGLAGGLVDHVTVRVLDALLALPGLPLVILAGSLAGTSTTSLILIIGLIGWPALARIVRSQILTLRQRGFIGAARGLGASRTYVLRRHLIPGVAPILVAGFVQWAGIAVLLQSGLALLGLGDPLTVSWGSMLDAALSSPTISSSAAWTWWALPPALAVTVAVLGFAFIGMGLESVFNPRSSTVARPRRYGRLGVQRGAAGSQP
jgi:ABC-type dipeptide/oligopeptide/nickel transport system permease subunit